MTLLELNSRQAALSAFYTGIKAKGIEFPPEIRALLHDHYNKYTDLKKRVRDDQEALWNEVHALLSEEPLGAQRLGLLLSKYTLSRR